MFKTIDQKIEDLGFRIIKNDKYGIIYKRWKRYEKEDGFEHYEQTVAILHKKSGEHILQSYCPSLFDDKLIGNTCVGLTFIEMKLFTKKMKKLVRMWS